MERISIDLDMELFPDDEEPANDIATPLVGDDRTRLYDSKENTETPGTRDEKAKLNGGCSEDRCYSVFVWMNVLHVLVCGMLVGVAIGIMFRMLNFS